MIPSVLALKLNSVSQLEPLSWNEVGQSHPYSPKNMGRLPIKK